MGPPMGAPPGQFGAAPMGGPMGGPLGMGAGGMNLAPPAAGSRPTRRNPMMLIAGSSRA